MKNPSRDDAPTPKVNSTVVCFVGSIEPMNVERRAVEGKAAIVEGELHACIVARERPGQCNAADVETVVVAER